LSSSICCSRSEIGPTRHVRSIYGISTAFDSRQAFHRDTTPIFSLLTSEQIRQIAELQADTATAGRIEKSAENAKEGELTEAEREEYKAHIDVNDLLAVMQAEARFRISHRGA